MKQNIKNKEQLKNRRKISKHLKDIRNKNPNELCKVIKKVIKKSKLHQQTSIDIDDLYKHFNDLNKCPSISDEINSMVD